MLMLNGYPRQKRWQPDTEYNEAFSGAAMYPTEQNQDWKPPPWNGIFISARKHTQTNTQSHFLYCYIQFVILAIGTC